MSWIRLQRSDTRQLRFGTRRLRAFQAARLRKVGGFDAVATSRVPRGSGLSSSAAYEVLIAVALNDFYNQGRLEPVLLAQIGQYGRECVFR